MFAIIMSIHTFVLDRSHWVRFLLGNMMVSFLIGIGQKKIVFFDILMSPFVEIVGYVYNLLRYFKLDLKIAFDGFWLDKLLCQSDRLNLYLETNAFFSSYFIKILVSFFLLGYLRVKDLKKANWSQRSF